MSRYQLASPEYGWNDTSHRKANINDMSKTPAFNDTQRKLEVNPDLAATTHDIIFLQLQSSHNEFQRDTLVERP